MPEMDKLLEQGIVPDAVMSLNDPSALGAMAALQEHGMLQDTAVYGVDGAPEAKSMISECYDSDSGPVTHSAGADYRADGLRHLKR